MQIQIENGYIIGYSEIGGFLNGIEVEESFKKQIEENKIGFYKYENGQAVFDEEKYNATQALINQNNIRRRREKECFSIINRGKLWYDTLTAEQTKELNIWYQEWLDAPQTGIIPDMPKWIKGA